MTDTATTHVPTHRDLTGVWESHPDEDYRRDMSHWRGHGRSPDDAGAAIGVATRAAVRGAAAMLGREVPRGPLLEWGPGGGTNLAAFVGVSSCLYGADLSPRNLAECTRVLGELDQPPRFTPIVVGDDPAAIAAGSMSRSSCSCRQRCSSIFWTANTGSSCCGQLHPCSCPGRSAACRSVTTTAAGAVQPTSGRAGGLPVHRSAPR